MVSDQGILILFIYILKKEMSPATVLLLAAAVLSGVAARPHRVAAPPLPPNSADIANTLLDFFVRGPVVILCLFV
jgi:hypothetical protein